MRQQALVAAGPGKIRITVLAERIWKPTAAPLRVLRVVLSAESGNRRIRGDDGEPGRTDAEDHDSASERQ